MKGFEKKREKKIKCTNLKELYMDSNKPLELGTLGLISTLVRKALRNVTVSIHCS